MAVYDPAKVDHLALFGQLAGFAWHCVKSGMLHSRCLAVHAATTTWFPEFELITRSQFADTIDPGHPHPAGECPMLPVDYNPEPE